MPKTILPQELQTCKLTGKTFKTLDKIESHLKNLTISSYAYFNWLLPGSGPLKSCLTERFEYPVCGPIMSGTHRYKNGYQYLIQKKQKIIIHRANIESYRLWPLQEQEIPYHMDGNKDNNSYENLGVLPFLDIPSRKLGFKINSSRKGKRAEHEVAQILQSWWGKGIFKRTPQSGAWDQGGVFGCKGDIVTTAEDFPLSVEVKNDEDWKFSGLFTSQKSKIHRFWEQSETAAKIGKLSPIIVFTRNYHPLFVGMELEAYQKSGHNLFGFSYYGPKYKLFFTLLSEFIKLTPEQIIEIYKK